MWRAIYWPCWELGHGTDARPMPISQVDFSAATHWILFGNDISHNEDGTFTPYAVGGDGTVLDPSAVAQVIKAAHAVGSKVTTSVGGANTGARFSAVTTPQLLPTFVDNIVSIVKGLGYDGVDIDWEGNWNQTQFNALIAALRKALPSPYIISVACGYTMQDKLAPVASLVDQFNIMNYDMVGNWEGWVVWHTSAIYPLDASGKTVTDQGGDRAIDTCSGGGNPPSDGGVYRYVQAGIPKSKIGIGGEFGGCVWTGVTAIGQPTGKGIGFSADVPYPKIMAEQDTSLMAWDPNAQATYIFDKAKSVFATFDSPKSVAAKLNYAKQSGIGGLMLWDFGMGGPYANDFLTALKGQAASVPPPQPGGSTQPAGSGGSGTTPQSSTSALPPTTVEAWWSSLTPAEKLTVMGISVVGLAWLAK